MKGQQLEAAHQRVQELEQQLATVIEQTTPLEVKPTTVGTSEAEFEAVTSELIETRKELVRISSQLALSQSHESSSMEKNRKVHLLLKEDTSVAVVGGSRLMNYDEVRGGSKVLLMVLVVWFVDAWSRHLALRVLL